MDLTTVMVIVVVLVALGFDFTNGFHDAANAIATSVSTRALTPRVALAMAATLNFVGAWLGVEVAQTIQDIIRIDTAGSSGHQLTIVLAALIGAITWNLITWYFGIPSSSTHALIGGIVGAGMASATFVDWHIVVDKVAIPMVLSPLLGFTLAFAFMLAIMWTFRRARPAKVSRGFRLAQTVSAAGMALGHGLQDAQKTMGIIVLALMAGGFSDGEDVPAWVIVAAASAIAAGTYSGGWRIMRTLGRRIIELDPPKGFAAEATAASILYVMAIGLHAPVSTTHTITSAVMGAGATKRFSAVRWGVAQNIVVAWIVTMPAAAAIAALFYFVARTFLP